MFRLGVVIFCEFKKDLVVRIPRGKEEHLTSASMREYIKKKNSHHSFFFKTSSLSYETLKTFSHLTDKHDFVLLIPPTSFLSSHPLGRDEPKARETFEPMAASQRTCVQSQ